jgi:hypothetical protein
MRFSIAAVAAIAVIASTPLAFAAGNSAKSYAPGQEMQRNGGPVPGTTGASGYAPGHLKRATSERGASKYAPGHLKLRHHARAHRAIRSTTGMAPAATKTAPTLRHGR